MASDFDLITSGLGFLRRAAAQPLPAARREAIRVRSEVIEAASDQRMAICGPISQGNFGPVAEAAQRSGQREDLSAFRREADEIRSDAQVPHAGDAANRTAATGHAAAIAAGTVSTNSHCARSSRLRRPSRRPLPSRAEGNDRAFDFTQLGCLWNQTNRPNPPQVGSQGETRRHLPGTTLHHRLGRLRTGESRNGGPSGIR